MNSRLKKFFTGLKYGLVIEIIVAFIYSIILLIFASLSFFSIGLLSLLTGSILLIIAGILGPGKYHSNFDLIIYQPKNGSTFIDKVPIAAFTVNENIKDAKIIINGKEIKKIEFRNNIANAIIPKDSIKSSVLNYIQIESDKQKSNQSVFTFYNPSNLPENSKNIKENETFDNSDILVKEREKYINNINSHLGYISLGLCVFSLLNFIIGYLLNVVF